MGKVKAPAGSSKRNGIVCLILTALLSACGVSNNTPDVDDIDISITLNRWDRQIFELNNKQQIGNFLDQNPQYSKHFLQVDQYPHDSLAINYLHTFIKNPASQVLKQEIEAVFGEAENLQKDLEQAFKYLRYYYPQTKVPRVYTAVTGFAGNDLFVSDSVIIIGLDYYLGEGATYRPLDFPRYILKRYSGEYIVPSIVLLLSSGINKTDVEDKTMLAEMVYFGKAYYFTSKILPHTPDSLLIGYSAQQMADINQNQDVIWAHFVENQLLYETSHFTKKKYMDERPKTLEIGEKCPGRIGEWLGWQIVKKYAEENDPTLPELMEASDAQQIFMQSNYKPQVL